MRKFINNKHLLSLSYKKQDLHKMYNQSVFRKVLTAFQTNFYKRQELRNYYQITSNYLKLNHLNTIISMESRLDVVLMRMNLVTSISESRNKLLSKEVMINHKIVKSYNYKLSPGDVIEVRGLKVIPTLISSYILSIPKNMEVNYKKRMGVYVRDVRLNEISIPFDCI